jgi:hypothetical protein
LGHQQKRVRELLKFAADFVHHSLRHTFGTRLGEAGADAFTIMRLMGHSSVTVSRRYVHPSPEGVKLAGGNESEKGGHKYWHTRIDRNNGCSVTPFVSMCPGGEIGRRNGLKSPIGSVGVSCYL